MSGLAERLRSDMEAQGRLVAEEQERAARQRAEVRSGQVERLRAALDQLSDEDVAAVHSSGGADLLTDALAPIIAARGERRSIVAQAETARQMVPVLRSEIAALEKDLRKVERDRSLDNDEWERGRRRSAIVTELEAKKERLQMHQEDARRAEQLG